MVKFYLVGGAVRDRLLGLEAAERDWVVIGATPKALEALGFRRLDSKFPVFAHPESGEEYALARRERKTGPGHKGFVVEFGPDVTLEEDLLRRDLRVNAIAQSDSGELIDPYGGQADIESRTLQHVSPAFVEDPLRVLRAARFAARFDLLGFSIHPSTLELMRTMSNREEMGALSSGRIWNETEKALATEKPARYFTELLECGALKFLLPEIETAESTSVSTTRFRQFFLSAIDAAAVLDARTEIRFAAFAAALAMNGSSKLIERIFGRFPIPKRQADLVRVAIGLHGDMAAAPPLRAAQLLAALDRADAFRRAERFKDALLVCRALEFAGEVAIGEAIIALERAFAAASAVTGAEVSNAGLRGESVAKELGRRRLVAVEESLATEGKSNN
ncbi:MAG: multifunctional CCA tRNA nucleotidyl transferase/2'3'-cyclic phosphodiesterase/2'nucleotidase/phosphatase [Gammaproteobacteria bacterium]|nr:multifunctional CCA tRNA nucleotidyl transferase/2'3'-cyclic phosphodiesterase/2'nucleotidase/phosphatase [Gammaproteobacteria bacterium]